MPLTIACPSCGKQFTVPDSARGRRVKCQRCQQPFIIPDSMPPAPSKGSVSPVLTHAPLVIDDSPEPWYYGFLSNFYKAVLFLTIVLGPLGFAFGAWTTWSRRSPFESYTTAAVDIAMMLVWFAIYFFAILTTIALLFLAVDAGRSLRAIRRELERRAT